MTTKTFLTPAEARLKMLTIYGRSYENGEPLRIVTHEDRIATVEPAWPKGRVEDWPYVAPGLFDLQINGYGGTWFSDEELTPDAVLKALQPWSRFGVTRLFPTLITNSQAALKAGFSAIRSACEREAWANRLVAGCHLEGPHLSPEDGPRGAHPRQHVRPANWNEFQELQGASGNRIKLVTIAPEVDGALDFIRQAVASGVVVSLGHTAATPEQIRAGVDAGARLSTHLGNGAHALIHRHRNAIFEQLDDARLTTCLIVDGHHLPAGLVRTFLKTKTPQRTILTCDAAGWAGCPPGIYESKLGKSEILPDGKLVVAGQRELLAGSAQETDICITKVMEFAGVPLKQAIDMTSRNPTKLFGLEPTRLRRGSPANLFLFKLPAAGGRLQVQATISSGELVFGDVRVE